ncbi:HNH endonuclease [Streptomyces sp. NPDC001914]|uniref:HNH endonuclease n=1 Tax=Streptomyces sp. NPDC001914 TaxID=3364623 RepID=UPI0036CBC2BA
MFRSDLAPLLQGVRGQNATSSTAIHPSHQVETDSRDSRLGANAGAIPKPANATGSAGQRRCPVCGNAGLADGRSRHLKCEGSRVPAVVPAAVVASDVDAAPDSRDIARYRELVSSVERREAATRGRRVERVNHEIVRLDLARKAVLLRCGGRCENPACGGQPADVKDDGRPILEVDHVKRISEGGRDHPVQMVALCPNCHAMKEHGRQRDVLSATLLKVAEQAHARW